MPSDTQEVHSGEESAIAATEAFLAVKKTESWKGFNLWWNLTWNVPFKDRKTTMVPMTLSSHWHYRLN